MTNKFPVKSHKDGCEFSVCCEDNHGDLLEKSDMPLKSMGEMIHTVDLIFSYCHSKCLQEIKLFFLLPPENLAAPGNLDTSYPCGISCESMLMFMKCSYLITHVFLLQTQALTITPCSVLSFCCVYGPIIVPNICLRDYLLPCFCVS